MTRTEGLQVAVIGLKLSRIVTNLIDLTDKLDSYKKVIDLKGEFVMVPVEEVDDLVLTSATNLTEVCLMVNNLIEENSSKERA